MARTSTTSTVATLTDELETTADLDENGLERLPSFDDFDSPDGRTHSVGDSCDPPHETASAFVSKEDVSAFAISEPTNGVSRDELLADLDARADRLSGTQVGERTPPGPHFKTCAWRVFKGTEPCDCGGVELATGAQGTLPGTPPARLVVRVPQEAEFGGQDYLESAALTDLGGRLIANCIEFAHLHEARVQFLWKAAGGRSKGNLTMGKCQKPSGLLAHFSMQDFIVWIAADNVRYRAFTERQIEALVFHELCHAGWQEDENNEQDGRWTIEGHDIEEFSAVIRRYGLVFDDAREFDATIRQLRLEEAAS